MDDENERGQTFISNHTVESDLQFFKYYRTLYFVFTLHENIENIETNSTI